MKLNHALIGVFAAAVAFAALATSQAVLATGDDKHAAAIHACTVNNFNQPVELVTALDNVSGYTLVWLTDADGNLWMCYASNDGDIYAYEHVYGDLLEGEGPYLIDLNYDTAGNPIGDPREIAERVCIMVAGLNPEHSAAVAIYPDGLSEEGYIAGYFIFVQDGAGDIYLCNASGNASIWAWAQIGELFETEGVT